MKIPMQMTISELADLTRCDRKTVANRTRFLKSEPGPGGARLYPTGPATACILSGLNDQGRQKLEPEHKINIQKLMLQWNIKMLAEKLAKAKTVADFSEVKSLIQTFEKDSDELCWRLERL
jgi:Glu-tRNA(Gln) amidotransferase subunit E-like FAD-binding protein